MILSLIRNREILGKSLRDQERENERGLAVNFDWRRVQSQLCPRERLVWLGARVRAIKRLTGVDENAKVDSITHAVGIQNVMLWRSTAQNDSSSVDRKQAHQVHALNVLDQIDS